MARTSSETTAFDLRIFSYLPNPRIWKATIAARLCGVRLDLRDSKPRELSNWLWDFDARPLTDEEREGPQATERQARSGFSGRLYKTEAFLDAHPFGTVPAAFSPDGMVGIFESNSIMRAVARLGQGTYPLYGTDAYTAARIDSFLDASLVFARDMQLYLLALADGSLTPDLHTRMKTAFEGYLSGIERGLAPDRRFLVGDAITLADICFVAELTLFSNEKTQAPRLAEQHLALIFHDKVAAQFPRAFAHYAGLCQHPAFRPDVAPYVEKLERNSAKDGARGSQSPDMVS